MLEYRMFLRILFVLLFCLATPLYAIGSVRDFSANFGDADKALQINTGDSADEWDLGEESK